MSRDPSSIAFFDLESLAPTADNFRPQIRDARLAVFVFATLFLICGIGIAIQAEPPLLERKRWAGIAMAGLAILAQCSSVLIPTRWIMWWSVNDQLIACIHANECRTGRDVWYWIREFGVAYLVLLPIAFFGIWLCERGNWFWGLIIMIPTLTLGVARIWHLGNKDSIQFFAGLEDLLRTRDYVEGQAFPTARLASTFLKQDDFFEVKRAWMKRDSPALVHWCQYASSGSSMASGVACVAQLAVPITKMVELLTPMSSVYYDRQSQSIFGTFLSTEESRHSQLAGLPWQFKGTHFFGRLDETLLSYVFKNESFDERYVEEIVDSWELLTEEIHSLASHDQTDRLDDSSGLI